MVELPMASIRRLGSMIGSFDEPLGTYLDKLGDRDVEQKGALAAIYRTDALSIRTEIAGDWLEIRATYRERGQEKEREAVLRYRFDEPLRTFLNAVLLPYDGRDLGRGRPLLKIGAIKVPCFDEDRDRNLAIVAEIVDRLRRHQARVRELRAQIADIECKVDELVYGLYRLGETEIATIEAYSSGT